MAKDRPVLAPQETELSRSMSEFDITMIGVGAMIGAGIFVLIGIAAGEAGPGVMLALVLNGVAIAAATPWRTTTGATRTRRPRIS